MLAAGTTIGSNSNNYRQHLYNNQAFASGPK